VSRSLSRFQALLLGVVVLAGLGLGAAGLFAIGNRQWLWNDTFHVQVGFHQVRGVEVGTRVRVKGRDAGEVVAVEDPAAPEGDVVLRLRLDGRLRQVIRADASAQIMGEGLIGGKVVEINPGTSAAAPVADNARIVASKSAAELNDVLAQVDGALKEIRKGQGTLGKLVKDEEAYVELLKMVRQGSGTLTSIQQGADAIKAMPIVRNYVKDAQKLLVRPNCERNRYWFPEADLFEPGRAVLTAHGRQELDRLAPKLEGLKHKNSEVVVSGYADAALDAQAALTLSQAQSEAVCGYLKDHHAVQKMGWFSRRKVTPIGLGANPPPAPDKDDLPRPRVEVLVFVPQG
jgi:phospholipid/cholesterol/gamma-HCH transport system substrate-binding protein